MKKKLVVYIGIIVSTCLLIISTAPAAFASTDHNKLLNTSQHLTTSLVSPQTPVGGGCNTLTGFNVGVQACISIALDVGSNPVRPDSWLWTTNGTTAWTSCSITVTRLESTDGNTWTNKGHSTYNCMNTVARGVVFANRERYAGPPVQAQTLREYISHVHLQANHVNGPNETIDLNSPIQFCC